MHLGLQKSAPALHPIKLFCAALPACRVARLDTHPPAPCSAAKTLLFKIVLLSSPAQKELSVLAGSSSRKLNIAFVWKDMKVTEYRRIMKRFKSAQLYSEDCIDMVIQASHP